MESYKCLVCGFISSVPGEHCGQQMVEQNIENNPAPATPTQEAPANAPTQEMKAPAAPTPDTPSDESAEKPISPTSDQ